jgi:hypothetical protein
VPNRWGLFYRSLMYSMKVRGTWPYGTEVPFSSRELRRALGAAGAEPVAWLYGPASSSVVEHVVNPLRERLHRAPLRVPRARMGIVDRLGYELTVVGRKRPL